MVHIARPKCLRRGHALAAGSIALALGAAAASAQPAPGAMPAHWNPGAEDCAASPQQPPLQVHAYEARTFILRQNPCADPEANFLYLLIGADRALLIDSGAVAEAERMPLATTVLALLPHKDGAPLPLIVAHTHAHRDHYAGDAQFASRPGVQVVSPDIAKMREFYGFDRWPDGSAQIDLGGRIVDVIPTPGHEPAHVIFYDESTALLFSGDFLLPGRLLIEDDAAYRESAARAIAFLANRPVTHILGGHVELDRNGHAYPPGSSFHPNEHALELSKRDLQALEPALASFNGFYAQHENFALSNPMHNLIALIAAALAIVAALVFAIVQLFRGRRKKKEASA